MERVGRLVKDTEVYGGVSRLFDKHSQFMASASSGTQAMGTVRGYYDVFGRSFFVGAKFKF